MFASHTVVVVRGGGGVVLFRSSKIGPLVCVKIFFPFSASLATASTTLHTDIRLKEAIFLLKKFHFIVDCW